MSASGNEPFYFKHYDKVIGTAWNVNDLRMELARLAKEDPAALEYHLREGHIVSWLEYLNEKELAEHLRGVKDMSEAMGIIDNFLEKKRAAPFHKLRPREKSFYRPQ